MPKNRYIPGEMEEDRIVPIMKPGIQTCEVVTKYRHISLLNVGRNIQERVID